MGIFFPDRCAHCIRYELPLFGSEGPCSARRFSGASMVAVDMIRIHHSSDHTNGRNLATAHRSALCITVITSNYFLFTTFIHAKLVISPPTLCLKVKKGKGMVLYSAVSSPLDRSKRFTLSYPGRPVHSDTVLGFSWKHSSHAAIAQRLFTHMSTTVYSQVLIYTAESTEAS